MQPGVRKTKLGITIGHGGRPVLLEGGTVAAAGSNQSGAAPLTSTVTEVTGASGTNGVRLPVPGRIGRQMQVYSSAATNALKVYPHSGGSINNGSANAAVDLAARTLGLFVSVSPTNWAHVA